MKATNTANSCPSTQLQALPTLPELHPTSTPTADLSNWTMEWWDPRGLDLEEVDHFLGLERLSPVADTIDPRCLLSEDLMETNSEESSWNRGGNVLGGIDGETEHMGGQGEDATDLVVSGTDDGGPSTSPRTRTRQDIVDLTETPSDPETFTGTPQKRKYTRRLPPASISLQTRGSTSHRLHPSENNFPPRLKRRYTRRSATTTTSPTNDDEPFKPQLLELPKNAPTSRSKRKDTRRYATTTTSLQKTNPPSPSLLPEQHQNPLAIRQKRKYTQRRNAETIEPSKTEIDKISSASTSLLTTSTASSPPKRKYTRRHPLPSSTRRLGYPRTSKYTRQHDLSSASILTFDAPCTKRKYVRRTNISPPPSSLNGIYISEQATSQSSTMEAPRVKRKYVRRIRLPVDGEPRRSRRFISLTPEPPPSKTSPSSPTLTTNTATATSPLQSGFESQSSSASSHSNLPNLDGSPYQNPPPSPISPSDNTNISTSELPSLASEQSSSPIPRSQSPCPSPSPSTTPDSIPTIPPPPPPTADSSSSRQREWSSSLSPAPSDFTPETPPPPKIYDSVTVRSPLPSPPTSSPRIPPRRIKPRLLQNQDTNSETSVSADDSTSSSEESSDEYGPGAGKSIESLNRLRRQGHLEPPTTDKPSPRQEESGGSKNEESVASVSKTATTAPVTNGRGEWMEEEYSKLVQMKRSRRTISWLEVARELNRPVEEIRDVWSEREHWMKVEWDKEKKTRLKELSEEYAVVKWNVIARAMGIDEEECQNMAQQMELT